MVRVTRLTHFHVPSWLKHFHPDCFSLGAIGLAEQEDIRRAERARLTRRWLQKTKTRPGGDGEIYGSTTFQPDGHIETEHGNSTQVAIDSLHRGPLSKTAAHELISALSTALDRAAINKNVDRSAKCICGCRHKPKGLRR